MGLDFRLGAGCGRVSRRIEIGGRRPIRKIHIAALANPSEWTTLSVTVLAGASQISYTPAEDLVVLGSDKPVMSLTTKGRTIAVTATFSDGERMNVQG
jgi:hypothetical protein